METAEAPRPDLNLAERVLPGPLLGALQHIFDQELTETWLVGGTALAGFYAGHRRSDDLDLFVGDEVAYAATVLAVRSLEEIGAELTSQRRSAQYYNAVATMNGHRFTIDVVLDANLLRVGAMHRVVSGICVASMQTLLRTKAATLVSRCSEKDLYDLLWILNQREISIEELLALGSTIDAGVNPEAVLMAITGALLRKDACDFGIDTSAAEIFAEVTQLKLVLEEQLSALLHAQPAEPLAKSIARIRRWQKR